MDAKNHFSGEDSFTEQMVDVWLLETHCGTLIVWGEYPFSEMGGFKSYLTAIIDTLQITDWYDAVDSFGYVDSNLNREYFVTRQNG